MGESLLVLKQESAVAAREQSGHCLYLVLSQLLLTRHEINQIHQHLGFRLFPLLTPLLQIHQHLLFTLPFIQLDFEHTDFLPQLFCNRFRPPRLLPNSLLLVIPPKLAHLLNLQLQLSHLDLRLLLAHPSFIDHEVELTLEHLNLPLHLLIVLLQPGTTDLEHSLLPLNLLLCGLALKVAVLPGFTVEPLEVKPGQLQLLLVLLQL